MNESLQRFDFDPILAALFLAFATGGASALVLLFDRWGGRFAQEATPASQKLATLEGLRGERTIVLIAHRLSAALRCDRINRDGGIADCCNGVTVRRGSDGLPHGRRNGAADSVRRHFDFELDRLFAGRAADVFRRHAA